MDCGPPGFSVHGILQARTLAWAAMPSSRGSSQPRNWTQVSCIAGGLFTIWTTRDAILVGERNVGVKDGILLRKGTSGNHGRTNHTCWKTASCFYPTNPDSYSFSLPTEEVCPPWIGSSSSTSLVVYNHILFVLLKFLLIRTLELKFCEKQLKEMTS